MNADRSDARVVLVTVPNCHLCTLAGAVVAEVTAQTGDAWRAHDLLRDPSPDPTWWDLVPIVLVDGEVVATLRVDPDELREALSGRR